MYLVTAVPLARLVPTDVGDPELVDMADNAPMLPGAELACTTLRMLLNVAKFVETYAVTVALVADWLVNIGVSL
jgi:hypothetical protein